MSESEQISAFVSDIQKVIDRYRAEFNLTLAAAVGSLEIIKASMINEALKDSDE